MSDEWRQEVAAYGLELGKPVKSEINARCAAASVWELLAEAGNLKRCHPFCASNDVVKWPGVGACDSITYFSGMHYQRNFVAWHDGRGYDIELGVAPELTSRVLWRVASAGELSAVLSIEVWPYLKTALPQARKDRYVAHFFGEQLQHYLDCVVQGVRYTAETGKNVQPDQFGTNLLYSASA